MAKSTQPDVELEVRGLLQRGETAPAASLLIQAYGPELLSFLKARLSGLEPARGAFAWLAEDLWRGLAGFRGDSSLRTWAYAVARNVARRYAERELKPSVDAVPLSKLSRESALAVRLPTPSEREERVRRIRAHLDDEEKILLSLRVDQGMDFREIALVMLFEGSELDEQTLTRGAARMRKRFQLLKVKLRGLIEQES